MSVDPRDCNAYLKERKPETRTVLLYFSFKLCRSILLLADLSKYPWWIANSIETGISAIFSSLSVQKHVKIPR